MKRLTFVMGHYGSGKSEFSVNYAIQKNLDYLFDLDIVNPYFRTRELDGILKENNIKTASSTITNSLGSDLPYISPETFGPIRANTGSAVYDFGGEDVGARVFRQYADDVDISECETLFCINIFRPETSDVESIMKMINKIEGGSGIKITGFVNTTNLLRHTTLEDIKRGEEIILKVSEKTNKQILYTAIWDNIISDRYVFKGEIVPLRLYLRKEWL